MPENEMLREVVENTPVTAPQPITSTHRTKEALEWDIQRYYEAMGFDFDHDEEDNNR